jgi:hypothetical protein
MTESINNSPIQQTYEYEDRGLMLDAIGKLFDERASLTSDLAAEREKNEKLRFMIDNGLGWEDMVDDTLPGAPVVKRPSESLREKNARLTEALEHYADECAECRHTVREHLIDPGDGECRLCDCQLFKANLAASAINKEKTDVNKG